MLTRKRALSTSSGGNVMSKYFKNPADPSSSSETNSLKEDFYNKDCVDLAKALLGQFIVRRVGEQRMRCRIVEVESYLAKDDQASQSYKYKQTSRNKAMFMKPGTLYVYLTYGMYFCMNVSSAGPGDAVLIRAAEPIEGIDLMKKNRSAKSKKVSPVQEKNISNGPSKLCQALCIDRSLDQIDLTSNAEMWLEKGDSVPDTAIVCCERIGLSKKAGEWQFKPLRFYIAGSNSVSVKNRKAEATKIALQS